MFVQVQTLVAVTGDLSNCSISSIISGGCGTVAGCTDKSNLLMASAFVCALVGLKAMVYSYMAKVNAHLCILAEA